MSLSLVSSYPSPSLHRSSHGPPPLGGSVPFSTPLVSFSLPYNKPVHKVAQQLVKGRCREGGVLSSAQPHHSSAAVAATLNTTIISTNHSILQSAGLKSNVSNLQVPQATLTSALTALSAREERWESTYDERPRKRHLAMSLVFPAPQYCLQESYDLHKVGDTLRLLRLSGYYYENLSWQDADVLLKGSRVGSFLVRNSRDNRFLFALTVQTERGPTSVRVHYQHGTFRLDCEHQVAFRMPTFPCVVQLVEYYISLSESDKGKCCVWLDASGRRDLPIKISQPRYNRVNSLQHLCRVTLNRSPGAISAVSSTSSKEAKQLPQSLKDYLLQYPHKH
ncbi:suppressor of cytokine signaling 3-like [Tropilaelaps mercedesae]|uniref:Suppressor of cytokine signaling 3-like n=1 Tax=Tropilaelaps mercedesae TaxID=418985 RepID=A0A1V9XP72_9ACAR|nr:suppressor of cytokine signaling 3-like [Tropilaelaps mercedesae]